MATVVFVRGLEFYAYHGVSPEEQVVGHRFRLDIEAQVVETAHLSDRVSDTVDYAKLADIAQKVGTSRPFNTVERLAGDIGRELMNVSPRLQSVKICLVKRLPPMPFIAEEVGVEIVVSRQL